MPRYQPARHGVAMSWERLEAAYAAPAQRAILHALELYHPLSGRHRFVADEVDLVAALEADAPADGGDFVTWMAAPLSINWPGQSDTERPTFSVSLDGVGGIMEGELRKTRESLDPWTLTARVYASDDLSGPAQLPPEVLMLSAVRTQGSTVTLTADLSDSTNVSVPALTFRRAQYPGLQR